MSNEPRQVASVTLRTDRPTVLSIAELYTWVIWQFPRVRGAGFCGAVRPPIANHSWLPALIRHRDASIVVHGHLKQEFSGPNEAADWLAEEGG